AAEVAGESMPGKRTKARAKPSLPNPGDAFLMPLEDGRYGVCRVLRRPTSEEAKFHGAGCVLVAASPWIGDAAPDLNDPRLRQIHVLTHHNWGKTPDVNWVSYPVPKSFRLLGTIAPSAAERRRV